jgi:hypothetical protein|tara:strand:- start:481 stop:870 length:390 start_codon:yes stop_codon:yes gene_type:complete
MATLTPTLTLDSSDATTDVLAFSVTDSLTVAAPIVGMSKITVTTTGSASIILPSLDARRYLYLKHTGVDSSGDTTTNDIKVEEGDDNWFSRLAPGEWLFVPLNAEPNQLIQLETTGGTVVCEYAYWTKG